MLYSTLEDTLDVPALPLGDHLAHGLVLLHLVLFEPSLAGCLVVGLANLKDRKVGIQPFFGCHESTSSPAPTVVLSQTFCSPSLQIFTLSSNIYKT